jgi:outer membrane murein-binding lipoprotein Lpp
MKRLFPAVALLIASAVHAQDLNVPAKVEAKVGVDSIIFINKITAKDVQFKVYGEGKFELSREPVDDPSVILFKFKPLTPAKYTLVIAGALGDKLAVRECVITAGGVEPVPVPSPAPDGEVLKRVDKLAAKIDALDATVRTLSGQMAALESRVLALETKKLPDPPVSVLLKKLQAAWAMTPESEKPLLGKVRAYFRQMAVLVNDSKLKTVGDLKIAMEEVRKSPLVLGDEGNLRFVMAVLGKDMDGVLPHNTGVALDAALRSRYAETFAEYDRVLGGLQ